MQHFVYLELQSYLRMYIKYMNIHGKQHTYTLYISTYWYYVLKYIHILYTMYKLYICMNIFTNPKYGCIRFVHKMYVTWMDIGQNVINLDNFIKAFFTLCKLLHTVIQFNIITHNYPYSLLETTNIVKH